MDIREAVSIFGLEAFTDDLEVLEKRYKQLIQKYHPDKGGDHEDMLRIQEALELLQSQVGKVEVAWKADKETKVEQSAKPADSHTEAYTAETYKTEVHETPYEHYSPKEPPYTRKNYEPTFTRAESPNFLRAVVVIAIIITLIWVCKHALVHSHHMAGFLIVGLCVVVSLRLIHYIQKRKFWKFMIWGFIWIFLLKLGWWI